MPEHYRITLSADERQRSEEIARRRSERAEPVKRALILLAADESDGGDGSISAAALADDEIAVRSHVSTRTIERLRRRCVEDGLEVALSGLKREPQRKIDGEVEAHLVALRCCDSPAPHARWMLTLLANRVVELGIVDSISYESVRQVLKKRDQAVACPLVGDPERRRGFCVPHGGRARCVRAALRCPSPCGVP